MVPEIWFLWFLLIFKSKFWPSVPNWSSKSVKSLTHFHHAMKGNKSHHQLPIVGCLTKVQAIPPSCTKNFDKKKSSDLSACHACKKLIIIAALIVKYCLAK